MVKFVAAALVFVIVVAFLVALIFQVYLKAPVLIAPLIIGALTMRHKITLGPDSMRFNFGLSKRNYAFADTFFHYGQVSGPVSWIQSFGPRTNMLHVQQQGKRLMKMPVNLSQTDFDALIATMKERGADIQPF